MHVTQPGLHCLPEKSAIDLIHISEHMTRGFFFFFPLVTFQVFSLSLIFSILNMTFSYCVDPTWNLLSYLDVFVNKFGKILLLLCQPYLLFLSLLSSGPLIMHMIVVINGVTFLWDTSFFSFFPTFLRSHNYHEFIFKSLIVFSASQIYCL